MDPKPRPNHGRTIRALRSMTPDRRLRVALDLGEWSRKLFEEGLRKRHPDLSEDELRRLLVRRMQKCHNRNY